QPPAVHALAAAINARLASAAVAYTEPIVHDAGRASHDLAPLTRALERGEVEALVVLGGDPVFTAELPVARAKASLYVGPHRKGPARPGRFGFPGRPALGRWGAIRAYAGRPAPQQPLIEPLYDGRSYAAVLQELLGDPPGDERVRTAAAWQRFSPGAAFEA